MPSTERAAQAADGRQPVLRTLGLTKSFRTTVACDAIDLSLRRGEIHGVLGENGAGKSTLMRMLIGLVQPDHGSIEVRGDVVAIDSPQRSAALGIGMVHQHFSLVEELRVWENVVLGDRGSFDAASAKERVVEIADTYGLGVDPNAYVRDLTAGQRQRVEIIKCLRRDPEIVIFDEPTSVLTPRESEQLFEVLRVAVERDGRAVALVSHKLSEILAATDDVTILRRGVVVDRARTADTDAKSLATAMVGRPVSLRGEAMAVGDSDAVLDSAPRSLPQVRPGARPLVITDANAIRADGHVLLDGLNLGVHAGEIVGVAGVEGNGQSELANVLSSLLRLDGGMVQVHGKEVRTGVPGAMAAAGIAVIPEDRHDSGCVLTMTVAENLFLGDLMNGRSLGRLDAARMRARAIELIERFGISCDGPDAPFSSLSGGNQQRAVLARELSSSPEVLVACQATRGLDVGAIEFIAGQVRTAAEQGVAVVLISSELEEILDLSHRIVVMHHGAIVGEMDRPDADLERLGLMMGGQAA